jgi:hypothetical protein
MPNGSNALPRSVTTPAPSNKSYANVRCRELHYDAYKQMKEKVHARFARKWTMKGGKFLLNLAKDFALSCAGGGIESGFQNVGGQFGTMFANKTGNVGLRIVNEIGKAEVQEPLGTIYGKIVDTVQEKAGEQAEKKWKLSGHVKKLWASIDENYGADFCRYAKKFLEETPDLNCKHINVEEIKSFFDEKLEEGEDLPKVVAYNLHETLVAFGDFKKALRDNAPLMGKWKKDCGSAVEVATAMYYFVRRYYKLCFHLNTMREEYICLAWSMYYTKDLWDSVADNLNNAIKSQVASDEHGICDALGCCYAAKSAQEANKPRNPRKGRVSFTSKEEQEKYFWSHNVSGTRQNY